MPAFAVDVAVPAVGPGADVGERLDERDDRGYIVRVGPNFFDQGINKAFRTLVAEGDDLRNPATAARSGVLTCPTLIAEDVPQLVGNERVTGRTGRLVIARPGLMRQRCAVPSSRMSGCRATGAAGGAARPTGCRIDG